MDTAPAVETRDLVKSYGERRALDGIGLRVGAGEMFGLLGPNGGGKSTLFRVLSTLTRPSGGTAAVFGRDVVTDAAAVRASIGVVFQNPSLDKRLGVRENLRYQGALYGLRGRELGVRIDALLARFHLEDRADDLVGQLSGGLARRVEIAKGLLHRPRLLLLDEPSTGLDPGARRELQNQLARIRDEDGTTIVLTTHILEEAEGCGRLVLLDRGRVVAEGVPQDLQDEVAAQIVTVETRDPEALEAELRSELGLHGRVVHDAVRLPCDDGAGLVARLGERLGDRARRISVGRPSLEDVFVARTGVDFGGREAEAPVEGGRR